jgi:hypothetical protein
LRLDEIIGKTVFDALIFTCHSEVMERDTVCAISACAQVWLEEHNIRALEGFARFGLE